jgi:membrane protein implicated in regulation of membrane protease activity
MSFIKEVFGFKNLIADVRTTIISMMTMGAVLFLASIGAAIWKSVRAQPIPWAVLILIGFAGISLLLAALIKLAKSETRNRITREKKNHGLQEGISVELVPDRWASPALATVINQSRDLCRPYS